MPKCDKKIIFYAPPALVAWLEQKSCETGAPVSELCRRAVTSLVEHEVREVQPTRRQSVLIPQKVGE